MYNSHTGKIEIAPIFDCGMGLFENDPWFKTHNNYNENLQHCYVEPYSEDPFKLLQEMDKEFKVCRFISKKMSNCNIDKRLFPSENYYKYYKDVLGMVNS